MLQIGAKMMVAAHLGIHAMDYNIRNNLPTLTKDSIVKCPIS